MNSCAITLIAVLTVLSPVRADEWVAIPAGFYRPLFRGEKDPREIPVRAFQLEARPVTNAQFLEFVRANPQWRRSQVRRLFADAGYLQHWAGDLDPGSDDLREQPVTNVSWFAAKACCQWKGGRLPTTAEWEFAAAAGYETADGGREPAFQRDLLRWYATPAPPVLPRVGAGRANHFGLHDLHGLIWEWTSDFNSALVTGDARGDTGLDRQLFCGAGSLGASDRANYPAFMRFGFRSSLKAGYTVHNLGFRAARGAAPVPDCCRAPLAATRATDRSLYQLASTWTNDAGREIKLGEMRGRPQVLAMFFAHCEYACPLLVNDLRKIENALPADLRGRVDFLLVSFDTARDTPAALHAYRAKMKFDAARWALLHGGEDDVRELAALLGVNYQRDARGQFAHSNIITVLNADGEIEHQQAGLNNEPQPTVQVLHKLLAP